MKMIIIIIIKRPQLAPPRFQPTDSQHFSFFPRHAQPPAHSSGRTAAVRFTSPLYFLRSRASLLSKRLLLLLETNLFPATRGIFFILLQTFAFKRRNKGRV